MTERNDTSRNGSDTVGHIVYQEEHGEWKWHQSCQCRLCRDEYQRICEEQHHIRSMK